MAKNQRKKKGGADAPDSVDVSGASEAQASGDAASADDAKSGDDANGDAAALEAEGDEILDPLQLLERELEQVRSEATEAADRALRTLAEFDNFRRRSLQERESASERGAADVLCDLLEVADNFDRALEQAGDDVPESFLDGMRLVARGLHDLLDRRGVVPMDAENRPFDPGLHQALTRQPTDGVAPNTVIQVVQAGYLQGDRVLRPAKVIVSAPMPSAETAPTSDAGGNDE